ASPLEPGLPPPLLPRGCHALGLLLALLVGQLDEHGERGPLVGAEVFLGEDVVEPADADVYAGPQEFGHQLRLLVGPQPAQPVPGFHDDDRAGLEAVLLRQGDQLPEAALPAVLVLVAGPAAVGEDLRRRGEVVPHAELAEHAVLPVAAVAFGLCGIGEAAVTDAGAARGLHGFLQGPVTCSTWRVSYG